MARYDRRIDQADSPAEAHAIMHRQEKARLITEHNYWRRQVSRHNRNGDPIGEERAKEQVALLRSRLTAHTTEDAA